MWRDLICGVIGKPQRRWAQLVLRALIGGVARPPWAALRRLSDDRGPIGYRAPTPADLIPYAAPAAIYAALLGVAALGVVATLRSNYPARR